MRKKKSKKQKYNEEVADFLALFQEDELVLQMKLYRQHGKISTFDHCDGVAKLSYRISKYLHLKVDTEAMLRAAMVHDFYLYDWHDKLKDIDHHATQHAGLAAYNSKYYLNMNEFEQSIISTHMWPVCPTNYPKSKEAWLVCLADKACCLKETIFQRH